MEAKNSKPVPINYFILWKATDGWLYFCFVFLHKKDAPLCYCKFLSIHSFFEETSGKIPKTPVTQLKEQMVINNTEMHRHASRSLHFQLYNRATDGFIVKKREGGNTQNLKHFFTTKL